MTTFCLLLNCTFFCWYFVVLFDNHSPKKEVGSVLNICFFLLLLYFFSYFSSFCFLFCFVLFCFFRKVHKYFLFLLSFWAHFSYFVVQKKNGGEVTHSSETEKKSATKYKTLLSAVHLLVCDENTERVDPLPCNISSLHCSFVVGILMCPSTSKRGSARGTSQDAGIRG